MKYLTLVLLSALALAGCDPSIVKGRKDDPVIDNRFTREGNSYPITRVTLAIGPEFPEYDGTYEFEFISSGEQRWTVALTCPTPLLGTEVDMTEVLASDEDREGYWSFYTWRNENEDFFGCYRYYGYLAPEMVDNLWQHPGFTLTHGRFRILPRDTADRRFTVTLQASFSNGDTVSLNWEGAVDSIDRR